MPLSKRILHNSGLFAPPDIFAESTPVSALDDANMARTIGVIQQISNLSMFAAEMFDNLTRLSEDTADRVREANERCNFLLRQLPAVEAKVRQTEIAVVEDDIHKKNSLKRSAIAIPTVITKKTNCSQVNAQYNMCSLPPQLWKIESIVPEDCMIAFSNPGFFFEEWLKGEQLRQEERRKERKKTKELKKKTKLEKRNKRRNRDQKSSVAGHEKSLMRQRIDMKSQKNNMIPAPLPPPDVADTADGLRKSSSFRLFDSFDANAPPPVQPEESEIVAVRPPPIAAQQPLRRPPPGVIRKIPSGAGPRRPSAMPGKSPSMHLFSPPPPTDEPDTPPPPSPGVSPPGTTPSFSGTPEPDMPPPPDDAQVLHRPPSLNIPPQQLPPPSRRRTSILNYGRDSTSSPPGVKASTLQPDGADDAVRKTPKRRQSVIQSAKFMKSPPLVGASTSKSPGINKLFSSSALSPEALAALTITPDSTVDHGTEKPNSTMANLSARQSSLGSRVSSVGPSLDKQMASVPVNPKMKQMESIVEDNEDTESRVSSIGSGRRHSIGKQRAESGGYQGGLNPFSSQTLVAATSTTALPPDEMHKKVLAPSTSAMSALTEEEFVVNSSGKTPPRRRQLSTFAVDEDAASPLNPTGISQSLMMEPVSPKHSGPPPNFGYTKDRFSMDVSDAWYRNSFAPQDKQHTSSNVNNAPVSEYGFVPMQSLGNEASTARRLSIMDHRSSSLSMENKRKSIINPFKSVSNVEDSGPTQADVDALNQARLPIQTAESGIETVYSSAVHHVTSRDDEGDLADASYSNTLTHESAYNEDGHLVDENGEIYDEAYAEEGVEGEATGTGGYYLATDGNYYYYDDADYYESSDQINDQSNDESYQVGDQLWEQRTSFLSAIKDGDITLRRTPATEKYMDVRGEVLAQIRTGAVTLKKMQPTMKPSTEQRHDAIAAILSNRQKIAGSDSDSDDYDSEDSGFGSDDDCAHSPPTTPLL